MMNDEFRNAMVDFAPTFSIQHSAFIIKKQQDEFTTNSSK